jgi:predicted nucleic acid-binding protein
MGRHASARWAVTRILAQERLDLREIDLAFAAKAARLAARHSLKGADATYLHVAIETRSTLITNDAELLQVKSRARVITPAEWLAGRR